MPALIRMLLLAIALALPGLAQATAQQPDVIQIDGKDHALNTNPLAARLHALGWKPPENAAIWSSNWRGYVARWKIEEGQLVLVDATVQLRRAERGVQTETSVREELFPSIPRVVADWYSGALIIPDGEVVDYVHMGYGTTYDHYQVIRISEGRVLEHLSMTGKEFEAYRERKFEAFTKTPQFRQEFERLRKEDDMEEEQIMDFMMALYSEQYLSL